MTTAEDFRVGGRIFSTPASQAQGYGNLVLTPEVQALFVEEAAELFVSIAGGWETMSMTHIRLVPADDATLTGALRKAWTLRMEKNTRTRPGPRSRRRARAPGR